jgi:gliding motility-associated lipoprotein GldD
MKRMNRLLVIAVAMLMVSSCGSDPTPLPVGQMRIAFPEHKYNPVDHSCPYEMEIPIYSKIVERGSPEGACWSNVVFPGQRATIHLTYRQLEDDLARTLDETHKLTYEHHIMADNIEDERVIYPENEVYGTLYTVSGDVASNIQFYVTDSSTHFLRGSLYFNAPPNKDSLAPVVDHLKIDIDNLLKSLSWKD